MLRSVIIFILLSYVGVTSAQTYNYIHYDLSDGLSGLNVYSMAQDKSGYMWFATETGLSRFDGSRFENYTTSDGLTDNEVLKLYVDSKNRVWILPFTNSVCYYKDGIIYNKDNDTTLAKLSLTSEPTGISEDGNGNVVIINRSEIFIITNNHQIKKIDSYRNAHIENVQIGFDDNGDVVVSLKTWSRNNTDNWGYFTIDKSDLKTRFDLVSLDTRKTTSLTYIINDKVRAYKEGNFLLLKAFSDTGYYKVAVPKNFNSFSYLCDTLVAFNCNDHIFIFNLASKKLSRKYDLGKTINASYLDSEGNLWLASSGYGLFRVASTVFQNIDLYLGSNLLPVYALYKKNNLLLAGSNHSLVWKINAISKAVDSINLGVEFSEGRITGIDDMVNGYVVGMTGLKYFHADGKFEDMSSSYSIKNIFRFKDSLLVSSNEIAFAFPMKDYTKVDTIWLGRSTCAYMFKGYYYVGTIKGLYKVAEDKTFEFLGDKIPELSSRISAVAFDSTNNTFWVATYGNGLVAFKNEHLFQHITTANGLSSNMCRNISYNKGVIWVGTDKGLNEIQYKHTNDTAYSIRSFTSANGLNCDIVNCFFQDHDTMYVGTPYGISFFEPSLVDTSSIAMLNIEAINSKEKSWPTKSNYLFLDAGDNRIFVRYACVSFKSQGSIMYYYRLEGTDNQWHSTKENTLDFATLSPGDYTLEMYAINALGKRSNTVTIGFTIDKFFYQKTWFIVVTIGVLAGLVFWGIQRRIRYIRKEQGKKLLTQKRLSELEQLAFRAQMNPHFIFNCLNAIQQYIFTRNTIEANLFITEFSSLIRQTLDLSSKKIIALEEEIKYLKTYLSLEYTRFDKNFDYEIKVLNDPPLFDIFIPPLLLQPFVENGIRHGIRNLSTRRGNITLQFEVTDHLLICTIEDNGVGRKASAELRSREGKTHESKGVLLIQNRIEALNAEAKSAIILKIEDVISGEKVNGTRVTVSIPLDMY